MEVENQKANFFFRLLVNKYFTGKSDSLSKLLPKEDADKLASCQTPLKSPQAVIFDAAQWISSCDPSWFLQTIQSLPEPLQKVYASIVHEASGSQLPEKAPRALSKPMQQFLLSYLHSIWKNDEVLPKELLQTGELVSLLDLCKQELIEIIDLLSVYDLVDEVRHIVDKRVLQSISQLLTLHQQQYLRQCLRQKTKPHTPSFTLRELLKDPKKFPQALHNQGIKRFALALSGEKNDFVWHIVHTLDQSRGKLLEQEVRSAPVGHATKMAQLEILQILQFLKVGIKS